jgi:hypothetical protein
MTTDDVNTLKSTTSCLITLSNQNKLPEEVKPKLGEIYRRYKEKAGEDQELHFKESTQPQPQPPSTQTVKQKPVKEIFMQSLTHNITPEEYQIL